MSIFCFLFIALYIVTLWRAGKSLKQYDPSKTTHWSSQNGWNLSFLHFTDEEYDYFCQVLASTCYKYATICFVVITISLLILLYPNERTIMVATFFLFISIEILTLAIMAILTKQHFKHTKK